MLEIPVELTSRQFEEEVERLIRLTGLGLNEFKVQRLEKLEGSDGIYEIDVTARFEALGADFLVLIECKYHKNPIKREVVQILYDRLRAVAAQKGMIFSTSAFQKGAIEFAEAHGIVLVRVADGRTSYITRSLGPPPPLPDWVPRYVGWNISLNRDGEETSNLIVEGNVDYFVKKITHPM